MSMEHQHRPPGADMDETAAQGCRYAGASSEQNGTADSNAARLQTIRELVETDSYHVPALIIAEMMIQHALVRERSATD